jgi:hypothetical protein
MRTPLPLILLFIFLGLIPAGAAAKTVALPITVSCPLLRSLVISEAFIDPGQKAVLLDENHGCRHLVISEPEFKTQDSRLRLEIRVSMHMGMSVGKRCLLPVNWEGYLAFVQKPRLDPRTWRLSFETQDSYIYDKKHRPARVAGIVWKLIRGRVITYIDAISVSLVPPVTELKRFLLPLFPRADQDRVNTMIESLRPGAAAVCDDGVRVDILADVEEIYNPLAGTAPETLTPEQWQGFVSAWETWDAFLVAMVCSLDREPLSPDDRQVLLDILLETRYRFVVEMGKPNPGRDFVREQFVYAWQHLAAIFKKHLGNDPTQPLMGYLSFFTAADALVTLDRLGPTLGIEISRNGFVRLARLLAAGGPVPLGYTTEVNPDLRQILGLGPALTASSQTRSRAQMAASGANRRFPGLAGLLLAAVLTPEAQADETPPTLSQQAAEWVFRGDNLEAYVNKIQSVLSQAAASRLQKGELPPRYHAFFRRVTNAVAWQESCLRQFRQSHGRVRYLRSYNNTSVGLMQINERVWRGIYAPKDLRWDIRYNARAGCEILDLYFRRYVLRRIAPTATPKGTPQQFTEDQLAALLYAMYNGGPGEFKKYLKRRAKGRLFQSDRLFMEKYDWVKADQWQQIRKCLVGG